MHAHFATGALVEHARFAWESDWVGYTLYGVFGRGYFLAHSVVDPFIELAFVGAKPINDCPGGEGMGGIGYRASAGADVRVTTWLKLGAGISYTGTAQGCASSGSDGGQTPATARGPPLVVGALGFDAAVTLLAL